MKRKAFSRAVRLGEILETLHINGVPMTARDIAATIGMKKSPHFIGMLNELVSAEILNIESITLSNGVRGYSYSINYQTVQKSYPELAKSLSDLKPLS